MAEGWRGGEVSAGVPRRSAAPGRRSLDGFLASDGFARPRFVAPRPFFSSSRRSRAPRDGFVGRRGTGGGQDRSISSPQPLERVAPVALLRAVAAAPRSRARRPRSAGCPPASASRAFTPGGSSDDPRRLKRRRTAVSTLLTFCPPGPEARRNSREIAPARSSSSGDGAPTRGSVDAQHRPAPGPRHHGVAVGVRVQPVFAEQRVGVRAERAVARRRPASGRRTRPAPGCTARGCAQFKVSMNGLPPLVNADGRHERSDHGDGLVRRAAAIMRRRLPMTTSVP